MINCCLINYETLTATRRSTGILNQVTGHYEEGACTSFTFKANVQPSSGKTLDQLPEGDRIKQPKTLFTTTQLKLNDFVEYNDEKYEVRIVKDYSIYCTNHYEVIMIRLQDQDESI